MDGVPLLATDRVRPWKEGRGGKVADCVGKAVLLPKDINHWAKWDDESLLLNMKREAIMVTHLSFIFILHSLLSYSASLFNNYFYYLVGIPMFRGG